MKFKQLPKEKKNNLILVGLLTAIALGGLGFGLIRFQYDKLRVIKADTETAKNKLKLMEDTIRRGDQITNELAAVSATLSTTEEGMATGDLYSWMFETIRRFKLGYKVEIPSISQPVRGPTTLLPKFPYEQASLTVSGSGYFHDLGKFIADFENQFPHVRILNLTLDPVSSLVGDEREKIEFRMDVVTLVRPNPS